MLYQNEKPQQLGLFHPIHFPKSFEERADLDIDSLKASFCQEFQAIQIVENDGRIVGLIPERQALKQMSRMQVQKFATSERRLANPDEYSLSGRIAWGAYLQESPEAIFKQWQKALGRGNGGIFWKLQDEAVGHRAARAGKAEFSISRNNRNADRITAYTVSLVHIGYDATEVELAGFAYRYNLDLRPGHNDSYSTVNIEAHKRSGVLKKPSYFKNLFHNN